MSRPATGRDPARTMRVSDADWASWHAAAKARGLTVSELIRRAMQRELARSVRTPTDKAPAPEVKP
jgi:hypothetical protein